MRFGWMAATVGMACTAPASAAQIISVNVADGVLFNSSAYRVGDTIFGNVSAAVLRENGTIRVGNNESFAIDYELTWERITSVTLFGQAGTELSFPNANSQILRVTLLTNGLQIVNVPSYAFARTSGFRVNGSAVQVSAFAISVPEPETWALLIAGFGGIGATLRTRRSAARRWSWAGR